jgi:hypothetical protein
MLPETALVPYTRKFGHYLNEESVMATIPGPPVPPPSFQGRRVL